MHPDVHTVGAGALVHRAANRSHLVYVVADVDAAADQAVGTDESHCTVLVVPAVADGRLRHLYDSGAVAGCH